MRIYLAARYSRHVELQGYRAELEALGHEVTSRWINGEHQISDASLSDGTEEQRERFAQEDRQDLQRADCVISFTEPPRSNNSRGGRHVEHGMALAWGKRVIVVGHRENVFHCLPEVEFHETWADCLNAIAAQKLLSPKGVAVSDGQTVFHHPGAIVRDELEIRGMDKAAFAKRIGWSLEALERLLTCEDDVNEGGSEQIGEALNLPKGFLLSFQLAYNELRQLAGDAQNG